MKGRNEREARASTEAAVTRSRQSMMPRANKVRTRLEDLDQAGDVAGVEERDPDEELWRVIRWMGRKEGRAD